MLLENMIVIRSGFGMRIALKHLLSFKTFPGAAR